MVTVAERAKNRKGEKTGTAGLPNVNWPPRDRWHPAYIFQGEPLGLDFLLRVMEATSRFGSDTWHKIGLWTTHSNLEYHLERPNFYSGEVIAIINSILNTNYTQRLAESFPEGSAGRELIQVIFQDPPEHEESSRRQYAPFFLGKAVFESLSALPADTVLPAGFDFWVQNAYGWDELAPLKAQIIAALNNPAISSSIRWQIPQHLARYVTHETLETVLNGYRMFGEPVGAVMRERMPLLFLAGLADEAMLRAYKEDLIRLYEHAEQTVEASGKMSHVANKRVKTVQSLLQRIQTYLTRQKKAPEPMHITERRNAERRVEVIRDLVRELFEPDQGYDPNHPLARALSQFTYNHNKVVSDFSTLPVDTLESYLNDLRQLKGSGIEYLANLVMEHRLGRLVSPYVALGAETRYRPAAVTLAHLRKLRESGCLEDRILDEILTGMTDGHQIGQLESTAARQNLNAMSAYDLPDTLYARDILPLLKMAEAALSQGLDAASNIGSRDSVTAGMLIAALPKLHTLFGDKYGAVLSYFKKKHERNDLRLLQQINNDNGTYVSDAIREIELASLGRAQGERLVKLAVSLNSLAEMKTLLGMDVTVQIVPDLKTSYERAQTALNEVLSRLGITSIDDILKFRTWLTTKDETALRVLRGEQIPKLGEPRTYGIEAGVKFDLEGMRREIEAYAKAADVNIPGIPGSDLNALKAVASYVMAEVTTRKDVVPPEVLGEVKPNLDRIITLMNTAGNYEISFNPQDLRSQMEALQNVTSCLSPGGSMFRHTQAYLRHPQVSWAVIRDMQHRIVGRFTVFYGQTMEDQPAVARVSNVYSQVPTSEAEVDNALRRYAAETGRKLLEKGMLLVPGLNEVYDDFARTAGPGRVAVRDR